MEGKTGEKIRVLIVDDEITAREGIQMYLSGEPDVEVAGECSNGLEAVVAIQKKAPDLVFLDVQMPGMDGFAVIEAVGAERMPAVIFVTAYDKYAVRAFEVHALDYLLKPFDKSRLLNALARARSALGGGTRQDEVSRQLLALLKDFREERHTPKETAPQTGQKYLERMVIKTGGRIFFINVEEIDWIEAADNYVKLHVGRESHLVRGTISGLESRLAPDKFLRVRRTVIVNVGRIKELQPLFNGEYGIVLQSGRQLTSSRRFRGKIRTLLGEL